ncbi:hypothetical protein PYW08_000556 [Mythimna loreyi]|uniref:Uncharacterized protein n=1 Tax=Mythimna loreyi TaxID=667449 RepID=A0ACC2RCT5_9NEOP|nr:hypothetical protein PYW08_000556 [Mythimna loreyi]
MKFSEKEILLREKAMKGEPLPEGKTPSEIKLINKVRTDLGLPVEPLSKEIRDKHEEAAKAGKLLPLEGKTPEEKEKILKYLFDMGIPLPKGRTPSEKALIGEITGITPSEASRSVALKPSEQMRRAKEKGLLTPIKDKTPEDKERILKGLAILGLPLPEGQSPSEKKLIDKVRTELGLPIEPATKEIRDKHEKAAKEGKLLPLEGKSPTQKEKILRGLHIMGIPLPVGRTPSEKSLIAKIASCPCGISKASAVSLSHSEKTRRAKAEGLMSSLKGKTPEQREKILKGLAMKGLPLPEPQSPSEKTLIKKVRTDLGVPVEPKTKAIRDKHEEASKAGKLLPLEGKSPANKEKILRDLQNMGIPLPVGRTPSEKSLIAKIVSKASAVSLSHSEKMRRAKAEGLMTSLKGKTPEQREKILKGLAMKGLPLPEPQSPSEKTLIKKVRTDLGVPVEPKTKAIRDKHEEASKAGKLLPLEGKSPAKKEKILRDLHNMGIPLPVGRTPSEKSLIAKIVICPCSISKASAVSLSHSEKMRRAKAEGLMTSLKGKTPEQREKILKGLAMKGLPLPEPQSPSEKTLIKKVRTDLGVPVEPKTKAIRDKHEEASKAGKLLPLEGKSPAKKEKILRDLHNMGIPLPVGRTPSEKSLIAKIVICPCSISKESSVSLSHSEKMRRAKAEGLMTSLKGKTPEQRETILKGLAMKGLPLPEPQSPSERKLIKKVRNRLGVPVEPKTKAIRDKHEEAAKAGKLLPLEGKSPAKKEKILRDLHKMGIPLPVGRTLSEKALIAEIVKCPCSISEASLVSLTHSEKMRQANAEGLMTPLQGKTPEQKEKIMKGLTMIGLPLPEAQSPSEKKLIDKVRADLGLPKEPDTKSMKEKYEQAAKAGLLRPLEGLSPKNKEKILKGLHDLGIPLPEGRTPSEKALVAKVKLTPRAGSIITAGVMTPLTGKTPEAKEKILRARAKRGIPLPEATSPSEKKLIDKVRADLGLPKEPDTKSMKVKHEQAAKAGLLEPLEGKTPAQKEAQLKGLRDMGIPLPEGRTPSEVDLINKITYKPRSMVSPSEQLRRAKAEGLLTPLAGKTPAQKEKILKGLAMKGIPLPKGKSPSEKELIDKVRNDLGLPKEPDTKSMKDKYEQAAKAGLLQPLVGKTPEEKEKILRGLHSLGIPLPEGRTPSEKALIGKVKESPRSVMALSEKLRRAKAEGLLTPLKGKTPEQKEKILKGLAMKGLPLPEAQSPSEKKLIDKVRADLGLPKDPTTNSMKLKHEQAAKAGILQPLEGKTPAEKAKVLKGLRDLGIPLPEGRTPSEKALIAKIKESPRSVVALSEKLRQAKAEGLLTPLKGKPPEQKEKILKGLAMKGLPLPEAQSPSEKKLIDKVRADLGLPKDPSTKSMKLKHEQAAKAGVLQPLEGKTPAEKAKVLKGLRDLGIPLPEGRTPSEKALIAKIKESPRSLVALSEKLRQARAEGLLTPLKGKSPEQKEKILKGLAMKGIPLPEAQSPSEKKLIDKVRADLGLPKDPSTKSMKLKHEQAARAGVLQPLEGKTPAEKAKVLKGLRDLGIPLPEGRTPSEKALIAKIKESPRSVVALSEKLRQAKAEGLLTPLKGKSPEQKEKVLKGLAMKGIPLPEAQSPSEKKLIDKVRADLGLPKEPDTESMKLKHEQAAKAGILQPLEGKTPAEKAKVLKGLRDLGIPLPEGRTPSEKALIAKIKESPRSVVALSEKLRQAKAEGLLTPLKGKSPEQKEKILKGLAMKGVPLPEAQSPSEKKLIDKVRADLGLPKDPSTKSMKLKHEQAAKAGLLQPLEGKTPAEKAKLLKGLRNLGIPLPEGRTPSEKALIGKVKESPRSVVALSEKLRKAKAEGLLTPLKGKSPEEKEKILKGLAMNGIPLPEAQSPSKKKLIDKVRADLGLPKDPTTKSMKDKHEQAAKAGLLQPLEGMTPAEKEKALKGLRNLGIPLPEGRTPSEKALIKKVKESPRSVVALSEKLRKAKAEGLLTPLKGKSPEEKEKILKGLAMNGIPLPEAQSPSEKKLIDKVRADLGLPKTPTTKSMKDKHEQAAKAGLLQPLEGMTPAEKTKILKGLRDLGIPLPEGRTPSEKALIKKVKESPRSVMALSEKLRRAKAEGLLTPLAGKTPEEKEKILKGLAMNGIPLPEAQSPSEKKLIDKVRAKLGLPKDPTTNAMKEKHEQAAKAGLLQPLEGKTPAEKEDILKGLRNLGIPLPEGRTPSEKALVAKIKALPRSSLAHSDQLRKAKAEGLLTPLKDKTPEEREKILKGLAMLGLPLPEGQSPSENELINKVRTDLGLPIEPKTKAIRDKHEKAAKAGKLLPLEDKTPEEKEKILKGLHNMGIPLPVGRTPSEESLIAKIAASPRKPSKASTVGLSPSEQLRRAKAEGLLTSLQGKTPEDKEKILRGLAMLGLPLPEGQSPSENKLIDKVRTDLGLPIEPKTKEIRDKHEEAAKAGKLLPLEGKTPAQKEKILKDLHDMGIPLPVGRTASEKALIDKIAKEAGAITSEILEIKKVTKCDRSCGCDKKKIRFKHSYVKIRVTSPDMSSFCDCPDECLPRVKSGVFVDKDGIQVTIGSAVGVPSLTTDNYDHKQIEKSSSKKNNSYANKGFKNLKDSKYKLSNLKTRLYSNGQYYVLNSSCSLVYLQQNIMKSDNTYLNNITTTPYEGRTSKSDRTIERCFEQDSDQNEIVSKTKSTASGRGSILVIKSEISLCSTISNKTVDTTSLISVMDSSNSPSSTHYSGYQSTDDLRSSSLDESSSNDLTNCPAITKSKKFWNIRAIIPNREYTVLRMSQTRLKFENREVRTNKLSSGGDPVMLINRMPNKLQVSKIMNKIMSKKRFAGVSSIFLVVPMSEDEEELCSSNCVDSMTSIHSIESETILKDSSQVDPNPALGSGMASFTKSNKNICGKGKKFFMKEVSSNETETLCQNEPVKVLQRIEKAEREFRQIRGLNEITGKLQMAVQDIGTDATTIKLNKNCSTIQHCSANFIPRQKDNHLPDMRTQSACLSNVREKCNVSTQTSVGCRPITHKATSCSRLPDMRMPSEISIQQLRFSSCAMRSRILPSRPPGCSHGATDMRTPSSGPLDQSCSVESGNVPRKTTEYFCLPDMSSSESPVSYCEDSSSSEFDLSSFCLSGTCDYCYPRLMKTSSRETTEQRSDLTKFFDSQVSLDDSWSHSDHCRPYNHKYYEPSRPLKRNRIFRSLPFFSSKEHKIDNKDRTSPLQSDLLRTETITTRRNPQKPLSHTIKIKLCSSTNKSKTNGLGQRRANRQSSMPNYSEENDCLNEDIECTNKTSHQNLQIQTNGKPEMPKNIDREKYYIRDDIGSTKIKQTNDIPKQTQLLQSTPKSKMTVDYTGEVNYECDEIKATAITPDNIIIQEPRNQTSVESKMLITPAREEYCLFEKKENTATDIIPDDILNLKPRIQTILTSKTPTNLTEEDCLNQQLQFQANQKMNDYDFINKDVVCLGIASDETVIQPSRPQANQKSKMLRDVLVSKEYFVNKGVQFPGTITDELRQNIVQKPSKDSFIKKNRGCQHQSKDSSIKLNCKCYKQSIKSTIKENNVYQQQLKTYDNKGFCTYEEIQERNRLCNTSLTQVSPSPKHSQISKLFSSIRKCFSHKIDNTMAFKISEIEKKSKKDRKSEKKSKKLQTHHGIQTIPEQIHQSEQMPPVASKVPGIIYDGYPYEYNCRWIDIEDLMRLRSELTEITCGFKVCKKRKRFRSDETIFYKQEAEIELDFEDAIKYYAGKNLDLFRDLIPQLESVHKNKKMGKDSSKKLKKKLNTLFRQKIFVNVLTDLSPLKNVRKLLLRYLLEH